MVFGQNKFTYMQKLLSDPCFTQRVVLTTQVDCEIFSFGNRNISHIKLFRQQRTLRKAKDVFIEYYVFLLSCFWVKVKERTPGEDVKDTDSRWRSRNWTF